MSYRIIKTIIFLLINILYVWLVIRNRDKPEFEDISFWLWIIIVICSAFIVLTALLMENYSYDNVIIISDRPNRLNVGTLMLIGCFLFLLLIICDIVLIYINY